MSNVVIRLVNETDQKSYYGRQGLENLICYMFNIAKTAEDSIRPIFMQISPERHIDSALSGMNVSDKTA